jgi:endonuclease/exonuclease/phosphatase family metal-dependent hydrolase
MKILTHNAYWFQGYPSRWKVQRVADVPAVVAALTRLYASANADVICLQEVHLSRLAESLANQLGMRTWFHAPGGLRPDYGGVVMSRRPVHVQDHTRTGNQPPHERVHFRVSLDWNGRRIELAAIHLPSDAFTGSPEAGDAARIAELKRILSTPPRPDIVAGDTNSRVGTGPYRFMLDAGYVDSAGPAEGDAARARGMDCIWLDQALAGCLRSFRILNSGRFVQTTPEGETWKLSDHSPLLVELQ